MCASAVSELISLGAIMPFLTILLRPDDLLSNFWINRMALIIDPDSTNKIVITVTILFVFTAITAAFIRLVTLR